MFVRVQREDTSTLYECGKADLLPDNKKHRVALRMEGVPGLGTIGEILHKGKCSLYFMNDGGETVDLYEWPVHDTGQKDADGNRIFTGDKVKVKVSTRSGSDVAVGKVKKQGSDFIVEYDSDDFSDERLEMLAEVSVAGE